MRPTEAQMEALLLFLERNPGVTKGHLRTAMGKLETKRKWQELSNCLNSMGGAVKNGPGWAKFWTDKKYALKKLQSTRNQSANRTGGGRDYLPELSPIEERMLGLLGDTRLATGDKEFSVTVIHEVMEHPQPSLALDTREELEVQTFFVDSPQHASPPLMPSQSSSPSQSKSSPILVQSRNSFIAAQSTNSLRPAPDSANLQSQPAHISSIRTERTRQRHATRRPYPSRSRSQLQVARDRLIEIRAKRAEAELLHAQSTAAIAAAINRLADVISAMSQSINRLIDK